jgi:hypothetical protein
VAAGIGHLEAEVLKDLFARLHFVGQVLPLAHVAAAAFVDRVLGVDQIAMVLDQPVDAVEVAAFLVGGERENQIAIGRVAFLPEPNQVGDELRRHRLVVAGAAAVEEAVPLQEDERIERPVLALRFDDVEVGEQEQRLARPCTWSPGSRTPAQDEIALPRIRSEHLHVGGWEAGGLEPRRHRLGGLRVVADRIGGVDLDQLFEKVARTSGIVSSAPAPAAPAAPPSAPLNPLETLETLRRHREREKRGEDGRGCVRIIGTYSLIR